MSAPAHGPHAPQKPKIAPGDPIDPRPGYGRIKPHFLIGGIAILALGYFGTINLLGAILFGLLLITWAVDNDYFDY